MKKCYLLIALIISTVCANAQFPAKISVNSNGEISKSPVTQAGKKYRITVEGSYSMWPQFTDCHGVDAAYVYDVPQEEIDALRWPPKEIKLGPITIPFVEIPHWMGDDQVWAFPPSQIGTPLFEISFRKHKGFRVDGEPLANSGLNMISHRYQVEKIGTGREFDFQILDSNYSISENKIIPRFEDNCGNLIVTVECLDCIDSTSDDMNICDINPICENGIIKGIKLLASIFQSDTSNPNGRTNIISQIPLNQLGLVIDGQFICGVDSIVCNERTQAVSVGLLIDRSGSMESPISTYDETQRINASKNAINRFIDKMLPNDSAFIMSFSEDINIDKDWTNDKQALKNTVNSLYPDGNTAFYRAVIAALDKISKSANPKRALIILSDGGNNLYPEWSESIKDLITSKNIPIYIIALGLSNAEIDIEGRKKMGIIAASSRGKIYDVYSASKLDSVYIELSSSITTDECCAIYFKIDPCYERTNRFVRLIFTPRDTIIHTKVINYICDTCNTKISNIIEGENSIIDKNINMNINPNPTDKYSIVNYIIRKDGNITITLYNLLGEKVKELFNDFQYTGKYSFDLDASNVLSGTYYICISQNNEQISKQVIVKH